MLYALSAGITYTSLDTTLVTFAFISCLICYLTSAAYHTFKGISEPLYNALLHLDYTGIIIATLGLQIGCTYYSFYCIPPYNIIYPAASFCLAVPTLVLVVLPNMGYNLVPLISGYYRATLFLTFVSGGIVPLAHLYIHYVEEFKVTSPDFQRFYNAMFYAYFWFLLGVLVWVLKFPECLWVGKFDIWASSHQWWHMAVIMGTCTFLYVCVGLSNIREQGCAAVNIA
eukprot:TRINITY_DN5254_c0_g2_i1.p1 TRINITY_DN5254_c0_g2~~TRINITY_DN5254_c0_g2_i1.p1  ORF type:complete len:227 (-),score=15.75 TRINITY_DN5254_c0_g2_i1:15-695(-)